MNHTLPIAGVSMSIEMIYTPKFASVFAPNPGTGTPSEILKVGLSTLDAVLSLLDRHSSNRYVIVTQNAVFGTTDKDRATALADMLNLPSEHLPPNVVLSRFDGATRGELEAAKAILFRLIDPGSN